MLQAFYWDVSVDDKSRNGTWWDSLAVRSGYLADIGITALWIPPPSKGNFGIYDMGYGIFDLYDLGNYDQKGTVETRFGSREELAGMMRAMKSRGIDVYADIVLNHIYTNEEQEEPNPEVKRYIFDEAVRNGVQYTPYPTNEVRWVIPNATPGEYRIRIYGYHLPDDTSARAYDLRIGFGPNNGRDENSDVQSGETVRGTINGDGFDEYRITLSRKHDIDMRLVARRIGPDQQWEWADQTSGYYPKEIFRNGANIATTPKLEARTNTGVKYVRHTGKGEANFTWSYNHFHPADASDSLTGGRESGPLTHAKFFGNDLNTYSPTVAMRYQAWGRWLAEEIGFDGFRLDFVRGIQPRYATDWVRQLPHKEGKPRFVVAEYWDTPRGIRAWLDTLHAGGARVHAFDFPLKSTLTEMCNSGQEWDMQSLDHAGLVRNNQGHHVADSMVVTFVENHDTGKEHDKWITRDWKMAYAYILTHPGRPCIFYNHLFGDPMRDFQNRSMLVVPDTALALDITKLIHIRKTYLGGGLEVLSQRNDAYPDSARRHVYAARRAGNGRGRGAIIVLNNHEEDVQGIWVQTDHPGWPSLKNTTLVNALDPSQRTTVFSDGRVHLQAPPRGFVVYVPERDYVAYDPR